MRIVSAAAAVAPMVFLLQRGVVIVVMHVKLVFTVCHVQHRLEAELQPHCI